MVEIKAGISMRILDKICKVEKKLDLGSGSVDDIISKMVDILLKWNRERTLKDLEKDYTELRKVAAITYMETKEEWQLRYNPPIEKIKSNISYRHNIPEYLFDKAISYLIQEDFIQIDVRDIGVERIAKPIKLNEWSEGYYKP